MKMLITSMIGLCSMTGQQLPFIRILERLHLKKKKWERRIKENYDNWFSLKKEQEEREEQDQLSLKRVEP